MTPAHAAAYAPRRPSRSRMLEVRGVRYHVREWGAEGATPLVLLHGALDTSASFQFLADALEGDWHIVAPDWRGHGGSGHTPGSYWQADFACDLDALLDALLPGPPLSVVGHSMGANVAALYAGLRPARVGALVMLDALGSPLSETADSIVDAAATLLDLQHAPERRRYDSLDAMAGRLMRADHRLDGGRALFLARSIAQRHDAGDFGWPYDRTFRKSLPSLHGREEWCACWRRIAAPVLLLLSSDPRPDFATGDPDELAARLACFRQATARRIPDTGHNLHHHATETLAHMIEQFFRVPDAVDADAM